MKIKIGFSQKALDHFQPNFVCKLFSYEENKIKLHDVGHMTKAVAIPIYVMKIKRNAMNRNWYNQKANPALNTKAGNK